MIKYIKRLKSIGKKQDQTIIVNKACEDFSDVDVNDMELLTSVGNFTMTSLERRLNLIDSLKYICNYNIYGSIVECGVWRGGMIMLGMKFLLRRGISNFDFYLYDTFEGMTTPTDSDIDVAGKSASDRLISDQTVKQESHVWAIAPIEQVRKNLESTGYPANRIKFVQGKVEQTIPDTLPENISILRLDTDWYESTKHELEHLYDRVVSGGVVIIDDYGYWSGAKKAVDEFIESLKTKIFLHRIDHTGRCFIKP